jgi:PmbA protein
MKEEFVKLVKEKNASGELLIIKNYHFAMNFENNKFKGIEEGETEGVSVRVKRDGKIGFSYSEGNKPIKEVVDAAFDVLQFGEQVNFDFAKKDKIPNVKCFDEKIVNEERNSSIELGKEFIDFIKSLKEGMQAGFSDSRNVLHQEIITTNGFENSFDRTVKSISAGGFFAEEGNFLEIYASQARSLNNLFDLETIKEKIKTDIMAAKRTVKITSGKYPVIFTPFGIGDLLMPLLSALNGKNVLKGYSLLKGKLGKEVFSPNFTIVDNPILSGGAYSAPFDDEGISSQRKELVAKGVISNYLSDLYTSSKLKIAPGNAGRSISSPPSPVSSNIVIRPGEVSIKNMIDIEKGILIESLMGVSMGNVAGGEVTGNIELGYLIENGNIVGRIKNAMIHLNVFEALKDIAISSENIWTDKYIAPYIYIPGTSISTK